MDRLHDTLDERRRGRLLRRYAAERRPEDLEALVISYRPLACSLARRYSSAGEHDADLEQVGCMGLVKALQRFEPARGAPFASFAVPTILGELRRYLRDTAWPAHVPRRVQEQVRAIRNVGDSFAALRGRPPTVAELVLALGEPEEQIVEALCAAQCFRTVPLDGGAAGEEERLTLAEQLGADDPAFEHLECIAAIERVLPTLPVQERLVLRLHFEEGLSQRDIAARVGFSRSTVGRVLESALTRVRAGAIAGAAA